MKKFLLALLAAWCPVTTVAWADSPARFWLDDKNYPLVLKDSQPARYLDKNSIKVKVNDPPFFIITAQTVTADGIETYEFFFDEDEPDMRLFDKTAADWRYLNPSDIAPEEKISMYVGEAVFYVLHGRKFYGNYLWKAEIDDKVVYADEFAEFIYKDWR